MKLSIKNVKINKTLSEETMCFSADVYVEMHPDLQIINTMSFGEACDLVDQIYKNGRVL